ncbi:MAG: hypothetical protein AMS18_06245 [Gemmatimonas sp. SG8_17]|nr:MAG: hypothetical protein AMS18_06245 [Gemmatimonas sp. SG8_17]
MMWAEAATAIATVFIALVVTIAGLALLPVLIEVRRLVPELRRLTENIDRETRPVLDSVRGLVSDASKTVATVRSEVDGLANTSRGLRDRVERAADTVEDRLLDLDALLDVVQQEVEDAALDISAALRTTRRGGKIFRKMKRRFLGRRR